MTPEQVRQMIREELDKFDKTERFVFYKTLQFLDGRNIQTGKTNGTKIGTASDQLLGFYGKTPVDRPATVSDAPSRSAGYVQSEAQATSDAINAIIDRLQELGLIA